MIRVHSSQGIILLRPTNGGQRGLVELDVPRTLKPRKHASAAGIEFLTQTRRLLMDS